MLKKKSNKSFLPIFITLVFFWMIYFGISEISIIFSYKLLIFFVCLVISISFNWFFLRQLVENKDSISKHKPLFNNNLDEKLEIIDDAVNTFSSSLNSNDLFSLLSSKISEILPYTTTTLFLPKEGNSNSLQIVRIFGEYRKLLEDFEIKNSDNFICKSYKNKIPYYDNEVKFQKAYFPDKALKTGLAVPLFTENRVYGVFVLFHNENYSDSDIKLIEAIGSRISPAFQNANNLERNLNTALTDSLTGYANERAFYLVLEQQIAEAERFHELRPLTLLSIDIKDFEHINSTYGHATGDLILSWISQLIKNQLRKMDFLARIHSDEFLIILPTANEEITNKIIKRIDLTITKNPYPDADSSNIPVSLNFSSATYRPNKDSAQSLVKSVLEKKELSKLPANSSVIPFPKTDN
jgi:diguanylate cyclase (GGDEF)-like protein